MKVEIKKPNYLYIKPMLEVLDIPYQHSISQSFDILDFEDRYVESLIQRLGTTKNFLEVFQKELILKNSKSKGV